MPKKSTSLNPDHDHDFSIIHQMITDAESKVWKNINTVLIKLYWAIGEHVSNKVTQNMWGKSVVEALSSYILSQRPASKGFSARNIWRMKQFYETYCESEKLSSLLTETSWSNHLHILSKTKTIEEKEFYLALSAKNRYPARELSRIIDSSTYERTLLANKKLSTALTEFPVNATGVFKDSYIFEFLQLSDDHEERDLRKALIAHLKKFLLELGPDFSLIGEEYPLQVGMKDFRIDLLLFHRGLNAMIAIELKSTEFHPSHLGQLQFYLDVLDKDLKKNHENPSIGILICKTKDEEVVKYALNRHASPTMIAEYETKLIDKAILQKKLHEFCFQSDSEHL
ncbi:MAG: PDDEXK nuclease domain-containing protein [Gammaproteobacteria bacterium]|nr:PDDEXK nuclease domain-containing protein [Gammaproteobacteria bacterium]